VALGESGALVHALDAGVDLAHVRDELGQVIVGQVPGRTGARQLTLYNSVGLGIQDLATARLLVGRARAAGLGTEVPLTGAVPAADRYGLVGPPAAGTV
jgi:ornithine cyclodeaminase/alanine dehydrogenase